MITLNINTDAAVVFTNKLEKMKKSALPNAVRGALNKAAFHTKKETLPKSAKKSFVHREANFFKANSSVDMAKGFEVSNMKSTVGFISSRLKGSNNNAVKELEQQEEGGTIGGRSFVPIKTARTGNSPAKKVKVNYRLHSIKNVINANNGSKSLSAKQKFIRAAIVAKKLYGNNAFVIGNNRNRSGKLTLSRIDEVSSDLKTKKLRIKRTALYTYNRGFKAKIRGTDFAKRAAHESGLRIGDFFIAEARRQFERIQKTGK